MFFKPLGLFLMGPELLESLKCDQAHEIRLKLQPLTLFYDVYKRIQETPGSPISFGMRSTGLNW